MKISNLFKTICYSLAFCNLLSCFQPSTKSAQEDKIEGIVAVSKNEAILINAESDSVSSLSLIHVEDSIQQIKWETVLPVGISFLSFDVEVKEDLVFIPGNMDENDRKLLVLNVSSGKLLGIVDRGNNWAGLNKNELFLEQNGSFKFYDIGKDTINLKWEVLAPESRTNYAVEARVTDRHLLISRNKSLFVFDKKTGEILNERHNIGVIGFSVKKEKILAANGTNIELYNTDNKELKRTDLSGAAMIDSVYNQPVFLGKVKNNWLLLVPTDLPKTFINNGKTTYTIPSNYVMLAIDANTLDISWELPLGKWDWGYWYGFNLNSLDNEIDIDKELNEQQLFHVIRWLPDGSGNSEGLLAYIDLVNGKIIWQSTYSDATRSNVVSQQVGDYFYLRIIHPDDFSRSALVQFKDGRLINAFWLTDYLQIRRNQLHKDAIWMYDYHKYWYLIHPTDFSLTPLAGKNIEIESATEWAKQKLGLNSSSERK